MVRTLVNSNTTWLTWYIRDVVHVCSFLCNKMSHKLLCEFKPHSIISQRNLSFRKDLSATSPSLSMAIQVKQTKTLLIVPIMNNNLNYRCKLYINYRLTQNSPNRWILATRAFILSFLASFATTSPVFFRSDAATNVSLKSFNQVRILNVLYTNIKDFRMKALSSHIFYFIDLFT